MDLFEYAADEAARPERPLADRMRPERLDHFVGQAGAVGPGTPLRRALESDALFSMILWGPPGCGKTTLARITAAETRSHFVQFSAVLSGVKEIRSVIETARTQRSLHRRRTVLFVDEIHRFNKAQQDAFLHHVEEGLITLIGATTENPSFEVIPALLSRCRVIPLNALAPADLEAVLDRALADAADGLGGTGLGLDAEARDHLARAADGDARAALNNLALAAEAARSRLAGGPPGPGRITLADAEGAVGQKALRYDKSGEEHYNLISAFIKSMRGSDPDAAVYWMTRMLAAGEDPLYVARRMVRFASEDVGNAHPYALSLAMDAMAAFRCLGPPEGELALVQAAVYLAASPKSNAVYTAHGRAREAVDRTGTPPVPLHIRNAPTALMKGLGYGRGYRYAHDYDQGHVEQEYLPPELAGSRFYEPTDRGYEKRIRERLDGWRRNRGKNRDTP